ncbi:putative regulatory protein (CxxC_CxxC_SSSS) [Brevibacterium mcbrellneri ATCC 49030]|uniref:Putative regulatory protein (CxxC_CxxC_SSSS) n=1 Tax=Brevibacterium mcbrellneri ATCC 49030 TaxID=585530 RepID=D4YPN0_9MICO|nr:FmdB family zinc ribbon protein [Brevibacterium mcbrellneri]EFG46891.1 putative regulatory protein (CxxC_CxxC_SSSS) [Brevibacterium mcbrellneri ATCC 49030]
MPTYSYACRECDHAFDIHQSFSDDSLTTCPACGKESLRKVFGSVGVTFKGSGFYRTDSRSGGSGSSSGSGGASGSASGSGSSSDSGASSGGGLSSSGSSSSSSSSGSSSSGSSVS